MKANLEMAKEELQALLDQRMALDQQIDVARHAVQAQCNHRWKLHQVVGDGRWCLLCELNDPFFDD